MTAAALILIALAAQAPARDTTIVPATGTASIAGTIVTDGPSPRPVRRAVVTVNSSDRLVGRTAVTDDSGRFLVANLPAGRFTVSAAKRGWVATSYGAKAVGRAGSSVPLPDGQRATIRIPLMRGAVIAGTVRDHSGQPPTGVMMQVLRYTYVSASGERRLTLATGGSWGVDERGNYRIWGLAPGEYYVVANGASGSEAPGRDLHLTSDVDVQQAARAIQDGPAVPAVDVPQRPVGAAPIYYPGTAALTQATPVTLRAGEERAGVDFTVQFVPTAQIDGVVSAPGGPAPAGTQVSLITQDPAAGAIGFFGIRTARADAAGKFTFAEVTPGPYTVAARVSISPEGATGGPPPQWYWAMTDLDITSDSVPNLSLPLQESLTISGTVRLDGASAPLPLATTRVTLTPHMPRTPVVITRLAANVDAQGRFSITGVTPGRYRLVASAPGSESRWLPRSAAVGGQEALDLPIEITQSTADAVVTFTDRPAQLSGHVQAAGAADYSVVLFSMNRAHWFGGSRRVMSARAASDGSFVFSNVPPGEYQIAAVDDVEQGEWYDPTFLQRLVPSALTIAIAEGEKKVQDIRAGGG